MSLTYSPYLAFSVPWGSDAGSIPHIAYETVSLSGMVMPASKRRIRPLYAIRLDQQRNLHVLFDVPQGAAPAERQYRLMRFDNQGNFINQLDISIEAQNIRMWHIVDFQPDHQDGLYLLEVLETNQGEMVHRLRRLNPLGDELWTRTAPLNYRELDFENLAGKFEYLIVPDQDTLFLPTRYPEQGLGRFDVSTGKLISVHKWDGPSTRITAGLPNEVYYSGFVDDALGQRYVLVRQNVISGYRSIIESEIQALQDLAGVDAFGNIYPRIFEGIARLSATGELEWQGHVYGVVARADDNHLFVGSRVDREETTINLEVEHYDNSGNKLETLHFELPREQLPIPEDIPRLVAVDSKSMFYLHTGETDRQGGTMFVFTSEGHLQTILPLNETDSSGQPLFDKVNQHLLPIESRVGSPSMFEVDQLGNVYIPLSDPEGFKVVRLQPNNK